MNTWFTADQHFDHEKVIEYCNRPFAKLRMMNNEITRRYREVIKPEDMVYFVGDLSLRGPENFGYYRRLLTKTLPGRKILILGNHDGLKPFAYVEAGFESVHTSLIIQDWDTNEYVLNHDPASSCIDRHLPPGQQRIWLCGHIHELFKTCKNVINVGVDAWNFYPVSFNQIYDLAKVLKLKMWKEWKEKECQV